MNISEFLEGYIRATNSHDFSNVASFVATDAIYWFTKNEYKNIESIQAYFENTWNLIKDEVYSISDVEWIVNEEHSAVCLYTYHWEGYYEGKLVSGKGKATNVMKKVNNEWKLIHEHLSPLT
ncbi:YybH family protein [Fredinandcohnia humi]